MLFTNLKYRKNMNVTMTQKYVCIEIDEAKQGKENKIWKPHYTIYLIITNNYFNGKKMYLQKINNSNNIQKSSLFHISVLFITVIHIKRLRNLNMILFSRTLN